MGKLRLGVIGVGAIAARHLAVLAEADPDVEVVAHLARRMEPLASAVSSFGGQGYLQLEQFIVSGRPDAVLVTVPPAQHGAIEHALIGARIPFLVETAEARQSELESVDPRRQKAFPSSEVAGVPW